MFSNAAPDVNENTIRKCCSPIIPGIPQGADVELMFPATFAGSKTKIEGQEKRVSEKLLKLLITYARIG